MPRKKNIVDRVDLDEHGDTLANFSKETLKAPGVRRRQKQEHPPNERTSIERWNASRTPEQRREQALKAGKARGEQIRRYKKFQEVFKALLVLDVTDEELKAQLLEQGLEPSNSMALAFRIMQRAIAAADVEAARFTRDTVGEKPTEALQMQVTDKPVRSLDMTKLTDAELEELADREDEKALDLPVLEALPCIDEAQDK